MSCASDAEYASHLLTILKADRARLEHEPGHASIVIWMVEELRTAAGSLKIERETAKTLLAEASSARQQAIVARQKSRRQVRAA